MLYYSMYRELKLMLVVYVCIAQQILVRLRFRNQDRGNLWYPDIAGNNRKGRFRQILLVVLCVLPLQGSFRGIIFPKTLADVTRVCFPFYQPSFYVLTRSTKKKWAVKLWVSLAIEKEPS